MPDEKNPDDIDQFLSSLHIPDELVDDPDRLKFEPDPSTKVTAAMIFPVLGWVFFIISALTIIQAAPFEKIPFFYHLFGRPVVALWDSQMLFAAMFYLFGNTVFCAGGVAIRHLKKIRLRSPGTVSLLITGGLSAVISLVLLITQ